MQQLKYDGQLEVATGKSRKETHWRNETFTWSELVDKLSTTHRTHETVTEYNNSPKTRQAEIKDIGGFVAGYVNNGRRKTENITFRSMLTLDLDFAKPGFWDIFTLQYDCAALVYSTHKHESPRLRLVIPLSRTVLSDEYVAIARRVAGALGINDFDDTTFEPARLMYWPSTSEDGEFLFEMQDGSWLDADEVLGSYTDWRNASEWPTSDRVKEITNSDIKKQGDPLEKTGTIGAFCREYTISEAIDAFLPDLYEATVMDDRYTYTHGSTAGGLVVYEDKFAFSHHGTDPVSGLLVNAFDLVRIHLYGSKDENAKEGTPPSKLPSFIAMEDFALRDKNVRRRIGAERLEEAKTKFADVVLDEEEVPADYDDSWLGELDQTKKGECNASIDNALIILRNDPVLKGLFALDKFSLREVATRNMPWRKITPKTRYLKDSDDVGVRHYIETKYALKSKQCIQDAMVLIVEENGFHPIKDYFAKLKWDGSKRVETLFIDYLGSEDTLYHREIAKKTCAAAIARIMKPGCKFDNMPTLIGKQGCGKSTFVAKLGRQWYSDSFGNIQSKEAYESIQGVWIMEIAEMAGFKKAEAEAVKHFVSKTEDKFRVAYGRRTEEFPRQTIFIPTSNDKTPLNDPTGNRRSWPIDCFVNVPKKCIWKDLSSEVDQIWAEALELYRAGETLFLSKEVEELARLNQEAHTEKDERETVVREYLEHPIRRDWRKIDLYERRTFLSEDVELSEDIIRRDKVTAYEIWTECYGKPASDLDGYKAKEIRKIMSGFKDWEAEVVKIKGKAVRGFRRISDFT